jgi:hypothetical protein
MRANRQHLHLFLITVLAATVLLSLYGCDGSSTSSGTPPTESYRVEATLIKDLNADNISIDSSTIAVSFKRNDSTLATGVVLFEDDTLLFNATSFDFDSMWSFSSGTKNMLLPDVYQITVKDASRFSGNVATTLTDTFRVDYYTGDSTVPNTNGQEIQISWTSALNITGYIIAAVLEDSTYGGRGYSQYVSSMATEATIPPDAFRVPGTAVVDTGWYNLYIYGYTGSPDSVVSTRYLPVPLPSQLIDNVDQTNLAGRVGSVVVTKRVPLHVVSQ